MKLKLLLLLTCLSLVSASRSLAVSFSLSAVVTPADLLNEGQLAFALNANGESVSVNGIDFTGLGFGFDPQSPPFDAQWTASGADFFVGFATGPLADAALDTLYANAFTGVGTRTLTLSSLVLGASYRLQILIGDDSVASRAFGVAVLGETFSFTRGTGDPAQALRAEFIATGASTDVTFTQGPGANPIVLNAFALHQVPEPGAAALLAVGAVALLVRRRGAAAALLLLLPATGDAALEWERTVQELRSTPAEEMVSAAFRFKNTGSAPVTIASIRPSCGCTTTHLAKRLYGPGESGEIVAEFRFGGRKGMQQLTVAVATDEAGAPPVSLRLQVAIEESLSVLPGLVFWRLGDAPTARQIELRAPADRPVWIASVESGDGNFKPQLKAIREGESYVLTVEPASTAARTAGTLTIKATAKDGAPATFQAFAIVR